MQLSEVGQYCGRVASGGVDEVTVGLLSPLTEMRRAHSLAVGRRIEGVSEFLPDHLRADTITAAYLHDVGYGHPDTGFHPVDGARLLHSLGYSRIVCHLVAFHTAARVEARVRRLDPDIFEPFTCKDIPELPVAEDFLWWADLSTGPAGEAFTVDERLAEIYQRYEPGTIVHTAISKAEPLLRSAFQRVAGSI